MQYRSRKCIGVIKYLYCLYVVCADRSYISGSSQGGGMSAPDGINPIRNRSFCSAEEMICLLLTNKREIPDTLQGVYLRGWRSCHKRYGSYRYVAKSSHWTAYFIHSSCSDAFFNPRRAPALPPMRAPVGQRTAQSVKRCRYLDEKSGFKGLTSTLSETFCN